MIIIEGPADSGKTTLVNSLSVDLQLPIRQPFTGHRGRGDFLLDKVRDELHEWPNYRYGTGIYDGYPLIDEYVYGTTHRGRISDGFDSSSIRPLLEFFFEQSLIIYCRPPDNVLSDPAVNLYDFLLRYPLTDARVIEYNYLDPYSYRKAIARAATHWRLREGIRA